MPRKHRELSSTYPYHITARCINREWFRLPKKKVWEIFCDYLYISKVGFNLKIHSFVLMSNHFHMIVSTPDANISKAMNYFMGEVSREITYQSGRVNQTFGGAYHASLLKSDLYYLHAYKYVYRNPVEAKICSRVEDYQYSTLFGKVGKGPLRILIEDDDTLFSSFEETLAWLNRGYASDHHDQIRRALRRSSFQLPRDRNLRTKSILEITVS